MRIVFHPLFLFVVAFACWSGFGLYMLICILAVLIHESSHAVVARHYGIQANRITMLPFGAVVNLDCMFLKRSKQAVILLAGAVGNIILVFLAGGFLWLLPSLFNVLEMFIIANFTIAFMNLLPFYPLDSGKIIALYANKFVTRFLYIISNIAFLSLFFISLFLLRSWSIALFAVCMFFTVNTQSQNEYVAKLVQVLDIMYSEDHDKKRCTTKCNS